MIARQFKPIATQASVPSSRWGWRTAVTTAALWSAFLVLWAWEALVETRVADRQQIARSKYLVTLGGCTDCHTPGHFLGKPDMTRELGGSEVGFEIPGLGVFYGPNLTPDKETGLGTWSEDDIVKALQTGF